MYTHVYVGLKQVPDLLYMIFLLFISLSFYIYAPICCVTRQTIRQHLHHLAHVYPHVFQPRTGDSIIYFWIYIFAYFAFYEPKKMCIYSVKSGTSVISCMYTHVYVGLKQVSDLLYINF